MTEQKTKKRHYMELDNNSEPHENIVPRWLKTLAHIYVGSCPLLAPIVTEKLGLAQPFSDYAYLGAAIFGISCITYIISWGVPSASLDQLKTKVLVRFKLVSQIPQLILLVYAIGILKPEFNVADRIILIAAYCFAVVGVISAGRLAEVGYLLREPASSNVSLTTPAVLTIALRALLSVLIAAFATYLLAVCFDFKSNPSLYVATFGLFLMVVFWVGDRLAPVNATKKQR